MEKVEGRRLAVSSARPAGEARRTAKPRPEQAQRQRSARWQADSVTDVCHGEAFSRHHARGGSAGRALSTYKSVAKCCRCPCFVLPRHKKAERGRCSCSGPVSTTRSILGGIRISSTTVDHGVW